MSDEKRCEHRHTHPEKCDDCGAPWCGICATYHERLPQGVHDCARRLRAELDDWRCAADELWRLLDYISTLDDVCKGDLAAFQKLVLKASKCRTLWANSYDGQALVWRWQEKK